MTFFYAWLLDRSGSSVLLTLVAHAVEGSLQIEQYWPTGPGADRTLGLYAAAWCVVAVTLLVLDRDRWWPRTDATATALQSSDGSGRPPPVPSVGTDPWTDAERNPMNRLPDSELVLVPGGTLITATPDEGRALAFTLARHSIHNIQPDLDVLKGDRPNYSTDPDSLIAASHVVAVEFATIAAANDYWRH